MKKIEYCLICNSKKIRSLKTYLFKFPGDDIGNHLKDYVYIRLWILFKKILKDKGKKKFNLMICERCGFIFINPRFSEKEIIVKYNSFKNLISRKENIKKRPPFNLDNRANRNYNLVNKFFNPKSLSKPKILDYGGSWGYILHPFMKNFQCFIIDYRKWVLPPGIKYLGKDISNLEERYKFDIILLLHTLEHIAHPKKFIYDLYRYLKDDGIIYVEVPLGCFKEWKSLKEPLTHLNFFSEESLFKLFKLCGLNVLYLNTSYQWVSTKKKWCVNIIGTRRKHGYSKNIKNVQSTKAQMSKIYYYFPDFLNPRKFLKTIRNLIFV